MGDIIFRKSITITVERTPIGFLVRIDYVPSVNGAVDIEYYEKPGKRIGEIVREALKIVEHDLDVELKEAFD